MPLGPARARRCTSRAESLTQAVPEPPPPPGAAPAGRAAGPGRGGRGSLASSVFTEMMLTD